MENSVSWLSRLFGMAELGSRDEMVVRVTVHECT